MHIAKSCPACTSTDLSSNAAILMPFVAERVFGWQPAEITADWQLRTIPQGNAQTICSTLECNECGLLFLDMRFDDDEMRRLYADYRGEEYTLTREVYEPGYTNRNQFLQSEKHIDEVEQFLNGVKHRTVLDYGGDDGSKTPFSDALQHVYEISGKRQDELLPAYDLIVCSHVLEHVPDPAQVLRHIQGFMLPDSVLYIELPMELPFLDLFEHPKRHWHEHINLYSRRSLELLLWRLGFVIDRFEQNVFLSSPVYMITCRKDKQ